MPFTEIAQSLLNLLIALCPPSPSASSIPSLSSVSPSFSPSQPSPSESISAGAPTATATTARQSERDRHLLQSGIPNAFSHEIFSWNSVNTNPGGGAGSGAVVGGQGTLKGKGKSVVTPRIITVDELREVKIRLREAGATRRRKKRSHDDPTQDGDEDGEATDEQRSKRWRSLMSESGFEEVQRLKNEADERERFKNEEREEREREKENGVTEEERERERELRRDKREKLKPGSVRYLF